MLSYLTKIARIVYNTERYPSLESYVNSRAPKNISDIDRAVQEYMKARTAWY